MTYLEQIPTPQLSKYIDRLWYCQADNLMNTVLTIPLLHQELVFNFLAGHCITRNTEPGTSIVNSNAWVSGIQTRPVLTEHSGKHEMMGVLFKPAGLKAFTKYPAADFKNNFIDATLVFDNCFPDLLEQIQNANTAGSKLSLIENYLLKSLTADHCPHYLHASLYLFSTARDQRISVKETCDTIRISNKSLIQSYRKHIGISPVKYLQLRAINRALSFLSKDPQQSLTQLAYELNFYDQAHFINLFKTATGLTPSRYAHYVLTKRIDKSSPNFISLQG